MNLSGQKATYFFTLTFLTVLAASFSVESQVLMYTSTTEDIITPQKISRKTEGSYEVVEIWEDDKYSGHYFTKDGATKKWIHQDKTNGHEFVAKRNGNTITITGLYQHKKIKKTVSVDDNIWTNKIDYGLSYFAQSEHDETTFWTLKLSDLEPLQFKAYKEGEEIISINGQSFKATKVKLTLKNIFLAKLWSAHLWYRVSDGLFLKYEGAMGRPGTPVTTIKIAEDV